MNESNQVNILIGRLDRCNKILLKQETEYAQFLRDDFPLLGKKNTTAMILAEFITDYYTCLETLFLRISQFFENNLSADRWHTDLLEKMTLNISGVRESVISDDVYALLVELMKFRHFRRYYFEMEYDWDKLDYLKKKFETLHKEICVDLEHFRCFLEKLT